jgi:hypothetical protein
MNQDNSSATSSTAERRISNQADEIEPAKGEHQDGHIADRTNMLPWDSCGPDCPVCAESER